MIITILFLLCADVEFYHIPPIRTCDEGAYLSIEIPTPPSPILRELEAIQTAIEIEKAKLSVSLLLRDFVHAYPTNRPMPNASRGSQTYTEYHELWKTQMKRRRSE